MTKKTGLTKKELKVVKHLFKSVRVDKHYCHATAQRVMLAFSAEDFPGVDLRYCEGTFDPDGRKMAHAWNTINGKLLDFSFDGLGPIIESSCYYLYAAKHTYTQQEVLDNLLANKLWFTWFADHQTLGTTAEM